jgi:ERF superfamily
MKMEQEMNQKPIKNIISALVAFQGALVPPKKETDNPYFKSKYADLAGVWESCRPLMLANGLAFVQMPSTSGNIVTVTGTLYHTSGESLDSSLTLTAKDSTPQAIGSAITYGRRYQMCAVLGIAPEDDDGAAASGTTEKPKSLAQQKGPFSHGIPMAQHLAEQEAKKTTTATETSQNAQQDIGSFDDFITGGKIAQKGPLLPDGKPQWTLYAIQTANHGEIKSFSHTVYQVAADVKKSGELVTVHCQPSAKGPVIEEIEIKAVK